MRPLVPFFLVVWLAANVAIPARSQETKPAPITALKAARLFEANQTRSYATAQS